MGSIPFPPSKTATAKAAPARVVDPAQVKIEMAKLEHIKVQQAKLNHIKNVQTKTAIYKKAALDLQEAINAPFTRVNEFARGK